MERGWKPNVEISPNCPRCGSSNTKFCYYNNYSLTQPRYFCKGCRRYWTKGGSLRNVPIGGGCRKNRRGKSVRLSTDHHQAAAVPDSKSFADEVGANNSSSTSSSLMQDGSHIDLALVYANFLNQQPASSGGFESIIPELPGEFDPCTEFSSLANTVRILPEENGLIGSLSISNLSLETHLRDNINDQIYYSSVFDSIHKNDHTINIDQTSRNNYNQVLPPLPNEDHHHQMAGYDHHEEILWLNSQMMVNHRRLEANDHQEPMQHGAEDHQAAVQDPNLLLGNWSPFDFSSDDTFTKT